MIATKKHRLGRRSRSQGFTLLELLITITVFVILAGLAFPRFRDMSASMTASGNTNALIAALNTARAEAVKRGREVAVISAAGGWTDGWCIKLNAASVACSTAGAPDPDEISSHGPQATGYSLKGQAGGTGTVDNKVVFSGTGVLAGSANRFDFSVCRPSGPNAATASRWITVAAGGVITSRRDSTSSPAGACS